MAEEPTMDRDPDQPRDEPPAPNVDEHRSWSKVWLVPILAAGIASWMFVNRYLEQGTEVEIRFDSAEGIVAGKTPIRYKDIEVGQVEEVRLTDDLEGVIIVAELDDSIASHLGEDSRFWVVKPRIGLGGVSGLDTLLSGSYIEVDPVSGTLARKFVGRDKPPSTPAEAPGLHLILQASSLGEVDEGTPIRYRGIQVGKVSSYQLETNRIDIKAFIEEPYAPLVRSSTHFWQTTGFELAVDTSGIRLDMGSFESLLRGGISFETPGGSRSGSKVESGAMFQLYSRRSEIGEEYVGPSLEVIMYFENSVRGLAVGAPVEFRGIRVGEVTDFTLQYDVAKTWLQIPVRAKLEPDRMRILGKREEPFRDTLALMIERGLRARIATGSMLTGSKYVDLDFDSDAPLERRGNPGDPQEIPTVESGTGELIDNASDLLAKLEKMPLESLVRDTRALLAEGRTTLVMVRKSAERIERTLEPVVANLDRSMASAANTLKVVGDSVPEMDGQKLQAELLRALRSVSNAATSIRRLADVLAREPEAIIRGRR